MKVAFKKAVSLVLSIAMILGIFTGLPVLDKTASAYGEEKDVSCWYFYNQNTRSWYYFAYNGMDGGIPKLSVNGQAAYCVQPNVAAGGGTPNITKFKESFWAELPISVTTEQKRLVDLALSYGFAKSVSADEDYNNRFKGITSSSTDDIKRIATQLVIWGILENWFDSSNETTALNAFTNDMGANGVATAVKSAYNTIKSDIKNHPSKLPSFSSSSTVNELIYDSATKKWSLTLTDSNSVADKYDWSKAVKNYSYLSVSRSGNKVTFTSTKKFSTITLNVPIANSNYNARSAKLYSSLNTKVQSWDEYGGGNDGINRQACATYSPATAENATVKLLAENAEGNLKIKKTAEDGNVSGITFKVMKEDRSVVAVSVTNASGEMLVEGLEEGIYIVEESASDIYEPQEPKTVVVSAGETAEVSFYNTLKRGNLTVNKSFVYKDGIASNTVTSAVKSAIIADITFTLSGTSNSGQTVNMTAGLTWNGNGYVAQFSNVLVGTYTLTENLGSTASQYIVAVGTTNTTISYKGNTSKDISNDIKTGNLKFNKTVEYGNTNTIQFTLNGTSDAGIPINMTVNVTNKTTSSVVPWMGTVNGGKVYDRATVTVTNGTVVFANIPVGRYTLTESKSNDCYIPMTKKTNVAIAAGMTLDYTGAVNGNATVNNILKRGGLRVTKVSENGNVKGVLFRLQGTSQSGENVLLEAYTNDSGIAEFNEVPVGQNYILTEVNAPAHFIPNDPITRVRVDWDTMNNVSVPNTITVNNWNKRGDLVLTKTIEASKYPENNTLEGYEFWLHGTSDSGQTVSLKAKTDSNGVLTFKDVFIGTYTLEEINTPARYIIPEPQTVTVHWNGKDHDGNIVNDAQSRIPAATANFKNNLKYFSVKLTKQDAEYSIAQGEGVLEGAVYGIYDGDILVDTYTTDYEGKFTTKEYECGNNWTIKEIASSKGYMVDETVHHIGAEPTLYTVKNNTAPDITSKEQIQKGSFLVLKTTGNGTGVYEFETGAEFEVYLTDAGSYANANEYERDILTIAADGTATTKMLPYGYYTIHQTKAWEGRLVADDYTVFVGGVNNDYRMIPINNGNFESRIKVVKVDGDTAEDEDPKAIPISGAAFKIYDPHGNLVVQKITYPSYMEFDTFYTNENGEFTTPEPLPYGEGYSLVEISAPYGYVLSDEPIFFDVTALGADLENGLATIVVPFPDTPQKGTIKIDKQGEVFASVTNENGMYQAQYATEHLKDATYAVYAVNDIYTPDGTLRYSKDEEVDRITTGDDGTATSKPLYLGDYVVVEVQTPNGMILDATPMPVTLAYADQTVELLDSFELSQNNDRQKVAISVIKVLETNDVFGIGANGEILAVSFGLYAGEDLTASDGTVIPRDGLIEVKSCDSEGKITFESDLPFGEYYVQEISTDEHYVLNEEKYEVSFEYQGQDVTIVELTANEGAPIVNELIYGIVGGTKVDAETSEPLSNAVIGLFAENTEVFTEDNAIMVTTTNEKGEYAFKNIPYGSYLVRELKAPTGYVLNENAFDVKIETDGAQASVTIGDKPIYGSIELVKTDADNETLLSGAKFEVWADVNGNGTLDGEDEYIGLLTENDGVYTYTDLIFGMYFVREVEAPADYLLDDKDYSIEITNDGVTYTVSNNDKGTFDNKHVPKIGTKADINGEKTAVAAEDITINDEVFYTNLYIGKEYTLVGVLMDKSTGEPLQINGETVTSTVVFVPEKQSGSIIVPFTFNSAYLTDTVDLVAFETLYEGEREWAVHADIEDEDQTVRIYKPELSTTASVNGEKEVNSVNTVTINDVVEYKNLVIGETYRVSGVLMDKATGEALLINGNAIRNDVEFTTEEKNGFVEVKFTFDVSSLDEVIDIVVFEDLYLGDMKLATHADIDDEGQTVKIKKPDIKTTATSNGDHEEFMKGVVTIKDDIAYHNLIVNKEYTVRGVLMDKSTNKEFLINGEKVTAETTFVAETADGTVSVFFEFDTRPLAKPTAVVAFERLECDNIEIAVHANIEDKDQTVTFVEPSVGTKLSFNESEMEKRQQTVLDDVIYYHNLIAGREYTLYGTLRDESGEIYIDRKNQEARSELTFVPQTTDGEVIVRFVIDTSHFEEEWSLHVVAFEELYCNGTKIAAHEDLNSEEQTAELFSFPEEDVPHGDFPPTGIKLKTGNVVLAALTVTTVTIVSRRKKRR